ncbi:unnamed protein product [Prunus armeniaca]|uniref:Uncharacterized protein n=1 Tax=Prunus armeniaca TaxID=36596 RepID=A0A6J5U975_PRUAR|nr:unnamed protein product [Prunus armeniaca]
MKNLLKIPSLLTNQEPQDLKGTDDLEYLGKVVAGSIVAAAVKYGSIGFPEITRPNSCHCSHFIFDQAEPCMQRGEARIGKPS